MENEGNKEDSVKRVLEHPSNTQVYNIVTGRDPSWQAVIYELVSSEQMDPWNIDISVLCKSYFDKIKQFEEKNFHVSSKMLLAAALLLRIKSEILLNKYVRDIDNMLFPQEEEGRRVFERIEIDEGEIPILSPKTPLPRFKKVTLQELINALDIAIQTESRRIDKVIEQKQAERLSHVDIPKFRRVNIKERIRKFYAKVLTSFNHPNHKNTLKLPYTHFTGNSKEEKIACFLPMLYLSNHSKLWLEQEKHYTEIYMYLYDTFHKNFPDYDKHLIDAPENLEDIPAHLMENFEEETAEKEAADELAADIKKAEEKLDETEKQERVEEINEDFENPIGDLADLGLEEN
jgi:segregation and condensation protein A